MTFKMVIEGWLKGEVRPGPYKKYQNLTVANRSFNPITKTSCCFLSLLNHLFKFRIPAFLVLFFMIIRPFLLLNLDNYPINFLFFPIFFP